MPKLDMLNALNRRTGLKRTPFPFVVSIVRVCLSMFHEINYTSFIS